MKKKRTGRREVLFGMAAVLVGGGKGARAMAYYDPEPALTEIFNAVLEGARPWDASEAETMFKDALRKDVQAYPPPWPDKTRRKLFRMARYIGHVAALIGECRNPEVDPDGVTPETKLAAKDVMDAAAFVKASPACPPPTHGRFCSYASFGDAVDAYAALGVGTLRYPNTADEALDLIVSEMKRGALPRAIPPEVSASIRAQLESDTQNSFNDYWNAFGGKVLRISAACGGVGALICDKRNSLNEAALTERDIFLGTAFVRATTCTNDTDKLGMVGRFCASSDIGSLAEALNDLGISTPSVSPTRKE
jgi:hypothetical protein